MDAFGELPNIPGDVVDKQPWMRALFDKQIEAWLEIQKQQLADQAAATEHTNKLGETQQSLINQRWDAFRALIDARIDATTATANARVDKQKEVDNARADASVAFERASHSAWSEYLYAQLAAVNTAELAQQTAAKAVDDARVDADRAAEQALVKTMHDAYVEVTKSSLDRSMTRLNVLTASIAAVTSIYTGLIALVYVAKPGEGEQLTGAAIVPAVFLGVALVLVAYYAAAFKKTILKQPLLPSGIGGDIVERRVRNFMGWCFAGVLNRAGALHAAIVALGFGVATLPVPFISVDSGVVQGVCILGGLTIVVAGLVAVDNGERQESATELDIRVFTGQNGPSIEAPPAE